MPNAERRFRRYFQNRDQLQTDSTDSTMPPDDDDILGDSLAGLDLIFTTTTGFRNEWRKTKTALQAVRALEQEFGKIRTGETEHSGMFHVVAYPAYCLQATEYLADAHAFLRSHHLADEPFEEGLGRLAPGWLRQPHLLTPQNVPPTLAHLAQRKEPVPTFYILRGLARVLKKQNRDVSDDEFLFLTKIFMENLDTPEQSAYDGMFTSSLPYLSRETIAEIGREEPLRIHVTDETRGIIDILDQYFTTSMLALIDEDNLLADCAHTYFEHLLGAFDERDEVRKEIPFFTPHLYGLFTKERAGKFVGATWLVRQIGRIAEEDQDPIAKRFSRDALRIYNVFFGNVLTPVDFIAAMTSNEQYPPTPNRLSFLMGEIRAHSREKDHWVIIAPGQFGTCSMASPYELGLFTLRDEGEGLLLVEGFLTQNAQPFLAALAAKTHPTTPLLEQKFRYLLDLAQNSVLVDSPSETALSPQQEKFFWHLTQMLLEQYREQHTIETSPPQEPETPPRTLPSVYSSKSKGPERTPGSGRKRKHRSKSTSQRLTEEVHTLADEARQRRLRPKFQYDEELFAQVQQKYGYTAEQMNFFRQKLANFNETQHGIFKLLSYVVGPNGGDAYSLRAGRRYRILAEKRNGEVVVYDILPRGLLPS